MGLCQCFERGRCFYAKHRLLSVPDLLNSRCRVCSGRRGQLTFCVPAHLKGPIAQQTLLFQKTTIHHFSWDLGNSTFLVLLSTDVSSFVLKKGVEWVVCCGSTFFHVLNAMNVSWDECFLQPVL